MKKIFDTFVLFCAVLYSASVFACSQGQDTSVVTRGGVITGGACSISELYNLEKSKSAQRKADFIPYGGKNLRTVNSESAMPKLYDNCLFGMCLYRTILKDESK